MMTMKKGVHAEANVLRNSDEGRAFLDAIFWSIDDDNGAEKALLKG